MVYNKRLMNAAMKATDAYDVTTLSRLFLHACRTHRKPDRMMVKEDGAWKSISTNEFETTVRRLSLGFQTLGLKPGDRVALPSVEHVVLLEGEAPGERARPRGCPGQGQAARGDVARFVRTLGRSGPARGPGLHHLQGLSAARGRLPPIRLTWRRNSC